MMFLPEQHGRGIGMAVIDKVSNFVCHHGCQLVRVGSVDHPPCYIQFAVGPGICSQVVAIQNMGIDDNVKTYRGQKLTGLIQSLLSLINQNTTMLKGPLMV